MITGNDSSCIGVGCTIPNSSKAFCKEGDRFKSLKVVDTVI
jgi:hypothetical protein